MNPTKAISLTLLLYIISATGYIGFEFLIQKTEYLQTKPDSHKILFLIILNTISHLIIFYFFWKPKLDIKNTLKTSNYNSNIYLYLPILAIGLLLLNKPFIDFINHLDFFSKLNQVNSFSNYNTLTIIYNIISLVIVVPILEELFFRRFLLEKLLKKNSATKSLIISSLCFSFVHFLTPANLLATFIAGLVLGSIYIKTRKVGYSIILHFFTNGIIQIVSFLGVSYENLFSNIQFNWLYWLFCIIGMFLTYFGLKKITMASTI
jgi:membrane protease YdiL (CAAX protease family)